MIKESTDPEDKKKIEEKLQRIQNTGLDFRKSLARPKGSVI